jgi:hypothetical protein
MQKEKQKELEKAVDEMITRLQMPEESAKQFKDNYLAIMIPHNDEVDDIIEEFEEDVAGLIRAIYKNNPPKVMQRITEMSSIVRKLSEVSLDLINEMRPACVRTVTYEYLLKLWEVSYETVNKLAALENERQRLVKQ